jgi:hypothetical protein
MLKLIFLVVAAAIISVQAFIPGQRMVTRRSSLLTMKGDETDSEMRDRLKKKARKMMFNENGVAYAPWISKQIDEDAIIEDLIRKEQGSKNKKRTSVLDRGEIESSEGMKWRMNGDLVDLAWITNVEENNQGYIVEKRPSYGGDFQEVASYKEVSTLVSKGAGGGRYRYSDPASAAGSWIYRVQDCDSAGVRNVLCQCFVEVQTAQESKGQALVAAGFAVFALAAAAVGYSLDPPY